MGPHENILTCKFCQVGNYCTCIAVWLSDLHLVPQNAVRFLLQQNSLVYSDPHCVFISIVIGDKQPCKNHMQYSHMYRLCHNNDVCLINFTPYLFLCVKFSWIQLTLKILSSKTSQFTVCICMSISILSKIHVQ